MLNPDLRESLYNARIAQEETKRVLLRMFPGLSFNYSLNKSNDSYLINDHWREAGVQVSFNLLSLLSAPQQWKLARTACRWPTRSGWPRRWPCWRSCTSPACNSATR